MILYDEMHVSRGWFTDPPWMDSCACPREQCGLTEVGRWDPNCPHHNERQTICAQHCSDCCPGEQ